MELIANEAEYQDVLKSCMYDMNLTQKTLAKHLFLISIACLLFFALYCCNNPVDDIEIFEPLQPGEVRIKARPDEDNKISFIVVAGKIRIDWGDGITEEFTPNGMPEGLVHEYTDQNLKTITIHTEEMVDFGACSMININGVFMHTFGRLEEIYFGKCTHLEDVILRGNDLIRLVIEEANSLNLFDCSFNNLSASALNSLFGSLPFSNEGIIIFRENTGSASCDSSIVLSKGWTVQSLLPDEDWELVPPLFDAEAAKSFAINLFSRFGDFLKPFFLFDALYAQTINSNGYYSNVYSHQINSSNDLVLYMWNKSYNTIRNLNGTLYFMLKHTSDASFSNYIHTAKVLRSYAFFNMINCWGDTPYLDETMIGNVEYMPPVYRMDKELLLNRLIESLLEAEAALPETETGAFLSKSFAQLILAKIYTFQGNYTKALSYTTKIMESGKYSLSPDYPNIFESSDNSEHLTQYQLIYDITSYPWEDLIKKGEHTPYARYAEVLLLASENYLKSGNMQDAVSCLNQVRNRNNRTLAGAALSISAIEDMILEEYQQDLGKEGLYFFALKRFGKAETTLGIESFRLLLPIPYREINSNPNITQNVGY